eukprot:3002101-Pleurochrysis_carterae.AAC.2
MEDIAAERVLCDVLLEGRRVIHLRVGGVGGDSRVQLPVVGCEDVVVVSPWAVASDSRECELERLGHGCMAGA